MFARIIRTTVLLAAALALASPAMAREWAVLGPRALGMGGAGVAMANDAAATYWNPAAYGFFARKPARDVEDDYRDDYGERDASAVGAFGFGAQVHADLGAQLNNLLKFDYNQFTGGTITATNVPGFIGLLDGIKSFNDNKDRSLTIKLDGATLFQGARYGGGGILLTEISARGDLDLVNVATVPTGTTFTLADFTNPANYGCSPCTGGTFLSAADKTSLDTFLAGLGWTAAQRTDFINAMDNGLTQANASGVSIPGNIVPMIKNVATLGNNAAGSGGSFASNTSRLLFKGVAIAEVPLSFGVAISDSVSVGANLKFMRARVYNTSIDVFNTDFTTALADATHDYADSSNFGLDLGLLYKLGNKLRVGVTARNVNSPEFDMKRLLPGDSDKISEEPQVRVGVAFKPAGYLTLALDYDVTENDTTVSDTFKSQNIGGGVELDLLRILKLRAGAFANTAADDIGVVYTAGVGLGLWILNIDAGASLSGDTTDIDGNTIPEEIKAEVAVSALF
ncbi:MAG: conjugal transfer protein TraF [Thermodesulfobacteriota bacterium]